MESKQPNVQAMPAYKSEGTGSSEWQSGLFDCCTGGLCLKATFCPCFVYGKTQARMKDPSLSTYSSFNGDCFIFALANSCAGFGWILACMSRGDARQRYGISGGGCGDCMTAYCCSCCSVIQVEKEVIARQAQGNGGYIAPPGMVVPQ